MNLQDVFCRNMRCYDRYKKGQGNIVWHGRKRPRCKCTSCGRTFSYREGTIFHGLRYPEEIVIQVLTLVAYGCPVSAIVKAFDMDERTVASWMARAGEHAEIFHHQHITPLDLKQVQVDEIRVKLQNLIVWVAMAMAVGSRLWLGAKCQVKRDKHLAEQIITCVYNWAQQVPLIISFDGWSAYPKVCRRLFREAHYTGKSGAPRLVAWCDLILVQVVKNSRQFTGITRWVLQGSCTMFSRLIEESQSRGTINTAYIERLNATFRGRLALATRRTRHPARQIETLNHAVYLVGCLYNYCDLHRSLGKRTPAMAAKLTDHPWTVQEFFYRRPDPFFFSTT